MKDITNAILDELDMMMDNAYWFFNHNNVDIVNAILEEIIMDYDESMYLTAWYLTNTNKEYQMFNDNFVKYVHNIEMRYLMWKIYEG